MKNCKPILLVEDDYVDAMTAKRAFKDLKVTNPLVHCLNGEEALNYLKNPDNEMPCVVLLDLNMPKMNGTEFLGLVKEDNRLKSIPVIVLTTSTEKCDISEAYNFSVGGYIVKPVEYRNFLEAIRMLDLYWSLSELPDYEVDIKNSKIEASSIG